MGKFFKMAKENNIRNATFKDNWMDILMPFIFVHNMCWILKRIIRTIFKSQHIS